MKTIVFMSLLSGLAINNLYSQKKTIREFGIQIGIFPPGQKNDITDVEGVKVGHVTLIEGDSIRTGVTAIIPHDDNIFQNKVPAAIHIGNGFGKLAGYSQVEELGFIETPIILTNTLAVSSAIRGVIDYTLAQKGNEEVRSVNAVVGETNDGRLNDIRTLAVHPEDVILAIETASVDPVQQGNVGAGTGTIAFGYKGGIGTSSRKLPSSLGGFTIGVLVQSNFGGVLEVAGAQVGKKLGRYPFKEALDNPDGSCMIVILTDAPVDARNLKRMARRAMLGLAKTGGMSSNGSGDYVIAVSTAKNVRYSYVANKSDKSDHRIYNQDVLRNDAMSPLFQATIECTEEAILNSLSMAQSMTGHKSYRVEALDMDEILPMIKTQKEKH